MSSEKPMILREIQRLRDSVPLPGTVGEMFDGPLLKEEFNAHRPAARVLERYQRRSAERALAMSNGEYKIPLGVRVALRSEFFPVQIVHRYPWAVVWFADGKRYRKLQTTLASAVVLHKQLVMDCGVKNATIISRSRGYDIPRELRGRLPSPWKWCPRCMKPKKYQRDPEGATTHVRRKEWNSEKKRYEFRERKVWLIRCPTCGCTNRDSVFRRSNQPWELRRFKQGVTRAKARHTSVSNKKRRKRG